VGAPARPQARDYLTEMYCRNVYPGEVDYLRSVFAARGPVRGVPPPGRLSSILEFFRLFFTPSVHYDYLWLRDPLPWIWQSVRAFGDLLRTRWNGWRRKARQRRLLREFERRSLISVPDLSAVLFLCYGNICRSAFARVYWNQSSASSASAESAGFHERNDRRTPARIIELAETLGVNLADHRSRVVDSQAIERATAIFVMDGQNLDDLLNAYPQARAKSWLLGSFRGVRAIRDPYLLSQIEATESLRQVKESIDTILERFAGRSKPARSKRREAFGIDDLA
jgi:protein-tyrosine phosphatase